MEQYQIKTSDLEQTKRLNILLDRAILLIEDNKLYQTEHFTVVLWLVRLLEELQFFYTDVLKRLDKTNFKTLFTYLRMFDKDGSISDD